MTRDKPPALGYHSRHEPPRHRFLLVF